VLHRGAVALVDELVEVGAQDAHASADPHRGQGAGLDPLSGPPDYADQARAGRAALGRVAFAVRIIRTVLSRLDSFSLNWMPPDSNDEFLTVAEVAQLLRVLTNKQ
jgi:hypothetical protein